MSGVRVLVGTRKGAFILTADGKRQRWDVSGPHFAGWEIYHMKGSPADPDRLYASQTSGWFGQIIQRSCDGGKTWEAPGGGMTMEPGQMPKGESNKFVYDASAETGKPLTTHQWYGGKTWRELAGLRGHGTGPKWQPGAGGMCLHTILLDPSNPKRIYVAISAAG